MKKHILRFKKIDKGIFNDIKKGLKTIETRAATIKFRNIKKGDTLVFLCDKERFNKEVIEVKHFKSIDNMAKNLDIKKVMPQISSLKEMKAVYYCFPGYQEKINKFGLIAVRFK